MSADWGDTWKPPRKKSRVERMEAEKRAREAAEKAASSYGAGLEARDRLELSLEELKVALIGKRVRMTQEIDDPAPLKIGEEGIVRSIEDGFGANTALMRMLYVDWDSGRTLKLFVFDPFEVVSVGVGSFVKRAFDGEVYKLVEYNPEGTFRAEHYQTGAPGPDWTGSSKALVEGGTFEIVKP